MLYPGWQELAESFLHEVIYIRRLIIFDRMALVDEFWTMHKAWKIF